MSHSTCHLLYTTSNTRLDYWHVVVVFGAFAITHPILPVTKPDASAANNWRRAALVNPVGFGVIVVVTPLERSWLAAVVNPSARP